MRLLVGQLAFR